MDAYVLCSIAYFDIVPFKMDWDKWQAAIMIVDKHELWLNSGLFSLWSNCVHDLAVTHRRWEKSSYLTISPRLWKIFRYVFPSSRTLVCMFNEFCSMLWHELIFKQRRTITMLASHMAKTRCISEEMYVKWYKSWNISGEQNKESIRIWIRSEFKAWIIFLNFGHNCPRTATRYACPWFSSCQLELAGTKCIHRKLETIGKFLLMQKTLVKIEYRKIAAVRFESRDFVASLETSMTIHEIRSLIFGNL